jgi:hypothetical protein
MRLQSRCCAGLLLAGLVALVCPPAAGAGSGLSGSLVGFVSDQAGIPQMGAAVLLYNHYDRLVGRSLTNERGAFGFDPVPPGVYSLRVMLASFVPALRDNIRVEAGIRSFLSISLASVLSSIELVYSAPGETPMMSDDWKWVLRTASPSRPLLRIVPNLEPPGPELGRKSQVAMFSHTRGLVKLSAGEEGWMPAAGAQTDLGTSFALATSLFGSNEVQFTGNVGYAMNLGSPAAGFRTSYSNDLWGAQPAVSLTMRQVFLQGRAGAAFLTGNQEGAPALQTMSVATLDRRRLTESLTLEYGASLESVQFLERLNYFSPYARVTYELGGLGAVEAAYSSGMPPTELVAASSFEGDMQRDLAVLALYPRVSLVGGDVRVQRAQNMEIAWRKAIGGTSFGLGAYRESVSNAAVTMAVPAGFYSAGDLLPDLSSTASIFNLGQFRRLGLVATATQRIGDAWSVGLSVGNGGVLETGTAGLGTTDPDELRGAMQAARRMWFATRLSGTAPWFGTRFSAGYQWTDYSVLSPTHLFMTTGFQPEPGLNVRVRQSLPSFGLWSGRLEATAELRNLLAQGYIPVSTADGRKLYLIHYPRTVRGGLSFIF